MKKALLLAATALALASCSQNGEFEEAQRQKDLGNPIAFDTYLSGRAATKAGATASMNTSELQKTGFGVFAYYTKNEDWAVDGGTATPNWMFNQEVTWNTTDEIWTYAPIKFWPNESDNSSNIDGDKSIAQRADKISFFAYAPYVDVKDDGTFTTTETSGIIKLTGNTDKGDPLVTYALPTNGKAVDLLWGTAVTKGAANVYETVVPSPLDKVTAAKAQYTKAGTPTDGEAPVNLNIIKLKIGQNIKFLFKHALSLVGGKSESEKDDGTTTDNKSGLRIVLDVDDIDKSATGVFKNAETKVTVKNIVIDNHNATTLDEDTNGDGAKDDNDKIVKGGTLDLATGVWDLKKEYIDIRHTITNDGKDPDDTSKDATALLNPSILEPAAGVDKTEAAFDALVEGVLTESKSVYDTSKEVSPFVFLPGTKPSFKITIEYIVRTKDTKLADKYSEVVQKISKMVSFPSEIEANKKYNITIHLGLTSINFEATVENWTDNGGTTTYTDPVTGETITIPTENTPIHLPINVK